MGHHRYCQVGLYLHCAYRSSMPYLLEHHVAMMADAACWQQTRLAATCCLKACRLLPLFILAPAAACFLSTACSEN